MSPRTIGIVEIIAILGCGLGGFFVVMALLDTSASAPQQAAMAAVGLGLAAIPYMIAATLHRRHMRERGQ